MNENILKNIAESISWLHNQLRIAAAMNPSLYPAANQQSIQGLVSGLNQAAQMIDLNDPAIQSFGGAAKNYINSKQQAQQKENEGPVGQQLGNIFGHNRNNS